MTDDHLISLQPGTVIGGKYEVVKCLGSGSMGLVYACRHRELQGQMVAVKVLFPEVARDKVAAARFRNEVLASYGVSHPNVVRAYEYLRDGDLVAYTMEYVGGGDLAEKLSRQERLPIGEIVRLLSQMAAGVQAIHDARIVHRDLKPENILLTKEGSVKIADFGIARTQHGHKLTEHGGVVGTIDYVAPEYMLRSQVDWRSDIYALGILAFEMVTGEPPFRGDSVYATMTKRLKTDPELPSKLRPECPEELDRVILKAMQREPHLRYQSALEMFIDLQKIANEEGMPSAFTGGVFLSNHSGAAGQTYVGPSVQTGDQNDTTLVSIEQDIGVSSAPGIATELGPAGASAWADSSNSGRVRDRTTNLSSRASSDTNGVIDYSGDTSTRVLHDELVNYAVNVASDTGDTQLKLEPILGPENDLVSEEWASSRNKPPPYGLISDRVRDLSQKYHHRNTRLAYLGDAIALFMAAIIGVGFGFVVLKLLWPSMLSNIHF
jgi:serine/threonine protein kinase